jgi:hypothetical protein
MDQRSIDEYRIETREDLCVVLARLIESLTQQIDAQDAETADDQHQYRGDSHSPCAVVLGS